MRVIADVLACDESFGDVVLTIGSFDGVHRGHRMILDRVVSAARASGHRPAMMTLDPHPRFVFAPHNAPNLLTSLDKKVELAGEAGIELFFVLCFNPSVAAMSRDDFLAEIILQRCGAKHIIVGHDFAFGKGAQGNFTYLAEQAGAKGFAVEEAAPLIIDGERVSSTLIRELILQGELDRAEIYLGRKYSIVGEVTRGRGMGRKLGYPTANIKPHHNAVPANGIYAARVYLDGSWHLTAVNVGIAPTLQHEDVTIEAYVLDFEADLVGKKLEIEFHKRLRPEKKFDSLPELIAAIGNDVTEVRNHFASTMV